MPIGSTTTMKFPRNLDKQKIENIENIGKLKKVNILNVSIDNLSKQELLERLDQTGGVVFTPNVDHLVRLQKDRNFYEAYNLSNYRVCDSKILMYASKLLGFPLKEKISGSDLFPAFYQYHKDRENTKIFLLGAEEGVAKKAQENINAKVDREIVVAAHSPSYGFENKQKECLEIIDMINSSGATVLAIGVGAPKQEKWIQKYKHYLKNIKVFLAIGATIDFEAGHVERSPKWMSEAGLEWFYRLAKEPKRLWKRYLVDDMPFLWLILQQKLGLYNHNFSKITTFSEYQPIGQKLHKAGLLSIEQVKQILQHQSDYRHQKFGNIIADNLKLLSKKTVDFFAEELPILKMKSHKYPLGQYLKLAGFLDDVKINLILEEQTQTGMKFGEIAVNKGWVKRETVDFLMTELIVNKNINNTAETVPLNYHTAVSEVMRYT
ncbi:MAG: WecB/TagA/CpsF family glycosyltransferase [Microcoleaceae cyanobacterium]